MATFPYYLFEVKFTPGSKRKKRVWRPVIEVILLKNDKFLSHPVLIDSGADYNLFRGEIAEIFGLKLTSGNKRIIYGLGNQPIKGYKHKIQLRLPGLDTVDTKAIFSKQLSEHAHGVLGNVGFFDKFTVEFDYNNKTIEVS